MKDRDIKVIREILLKRSKQNLNEMIKLKEKTDQESDRRFWRHSGQCDAFTEAIHVIDTILEIEDGENELQEILRKQGKGGAL